MANLPEGSGAITTYAFLDPGVGAGFATTVPPRTRWRLMSLSFDSVAGALPALRVVYVTIQDAGRIIFLTPTTQTQPNSTTYIVTAQALNAVPATLMSNTLTLPLPGPVLIDAGMTITIATDILTANDQYQNIRLHVEEWIEP